MRALRAASTEEAPERMKAYFEAEGNGALGALYGLNQSETAALLEEAGLARGR